MRTSFNDAKLGSLLMKQGQKFVIFKSFQSWQIKDEYSKQMVATFKNLWIDACFTDEYVSGRRQLRAKSQRAV